MAGSITVTSAVADCGVQAVKYSVDWTSDAAGAVSGNAFDMDGGEILSVTFVPDGGGTQPTDLYDVTLLDANNVDILGGLGANLSNSASSRVKPALSTYGRYMIQAGSFTPTITNAGNAKGGLIHILVA